MTVMEARPAKIISSKITEFDALYLNAFPLVAKFVRKMKGSFEDAKDIFHDALVIYHEKTQQETFRINVSEEVYVLGIAKHLWIRKFNHDKHQIPVDFFEHEITIPDDYYTEIDDTKLLNFLETFGRRCMELLSAFYVEKRPLSDIREKFNFRTTHSATVQKFKCVEKIRKTVKEKSIEYETFFG
jgi:DNA-directed RNA polymerase specialized sigma24 family protein